MRCRTRSSIWADFGDGLNAGPAFRADAARVPGQIVAASHTGTGLLPVAPDPPSVVKDKGDGDHRIDADTDRKDGQERRTPRRPAVVEGSHGMYNAERKPQREEPRKAVQHHPKLNPVPPPQQRSGPSGPHEVGRSECLDRALVCQRLHGQQPRNRRGSGRRDERRVCLARSAGH